MRRAVVIALLLLLPAAAAAQQPAPVGQDTKELQPAVRAGFPPPSIRIGEFRASLRVRLHFDLRDYDPDLPLEGGDFIFRRARVALEGRVFDDLEYEFDADLRDEERPWRDVYVNYRRFRAAEVQVGRFKIPFGLDQLTGVFNLSFVERSLIGNDLSPARDRGVMVHGRLARDTISYQTGVFRRDGDSTRFAGPSVDGTWAGRVVLTPWENSKNRLRSAQFGVNATSGSLFEGLYGMRGRTLSGTVFFEPVYVKGQRLRLGVDGRWTPGPVLVQAEYIRVTDERNGQGLGDVDLPEAVAEGWYVSGTWAITGENKTGGGLNPSRPFPTKGIGAVEVAARLEELRFGSNGTGGEPPFSNPRAANILPNRDRILTLGVNWYLNRFARLTVNGTRETLQDPARTPIPGRTRFWGTVLRLQFVL
jgi:phosphate-selective porin OprO and OprP